MDRPRPHRLRVVTWNIHGAVGAGRLHDPARTAGVLRALDPDVVALQEVDSRRVRDGAADLFAYLGGALGGHAVEAKAISTADGHYGQLLISRWPLSDRRVHDISVAGREPRRILEVRVDLPAGALRVIATHLGLSAGERRHQFRALAEVAKRDADLPRVLMGDLNEWRRRGPGHRILAPLFDACTSERTFPAALPLLSLDRIYCRPGRLLRRAWTERPARHASDHLPLVADLDLGDGR